VPSSRNFKARLPKTGASTIDVKPMTAESSLEWWRLIAHPPFGPRILRCSIKCANSREEADELSLSVHPGFLQHRLDLHREAVVVASARNCPASMKLT